MSISKLVFNGNLLLLNIYYTFLCHALYVTLNFKTGMIVFITKEKKNYIITSKVLECNAVLHKIQYNVVRHKIAKMC